MSSYIFSSNVNRRYVFGLLLFVFFPTYLLFAVGVYLEPLYGDLTRIGYYSEREFGWHKPQERFYRALYDTDKYAEYHDIIVLGDSFSRAWPLHQWQNYVIAKTGWSIVTLNINTVRLDQLIESRAFRETPPKILVLESIERSFPGRLSEEKPCLVSGASNHQDRLLSGSLASPVPQEMISTQTVYREYDWNNVKLPFVVRYLVHSARRRFGAQEPTDVRKVRLVMPSLFSSRNAQEVLLFADDFRKASDWRQLNWNELSCKIERVRSLVEANGETRFILMLAPNKLSAYSDFIDDSEIQSLSKLGEFSLRHPNLIPRLDLALVSGIRSGIQDVYLPDDTHWGSAGHRIVAETLMKFFGVKE